MRKRIGAACLALVAASAGRAEAEEIAREQLAPTGDLRVAIAIAPVPSAFFAVAGADGKPRGVAVALGAALAAKLEVPVRFVVYPNSGAITEAAGKHQWDVTFMPVDDERRKSVDFGAAYNRFDSTFIVRAGLPARRLADLDREGLRLVGIANTTTIRAAQRVFKVAQVRPVGSVHLALQLMLREQADALALSRNTLRGLAKELPGAHILEEHFHVTSTAVAVPKGHAAALDFASAVVEEAKASGLVRRALDEVGLKDADVAPPGAR